MRSIVAAAILLAMTGLAAAADYYAPSSLGPYCWIGPYVGANAGYQWGWVSNSPIQPTARTAPV